MKPLFFYHIEKTGGRSLRISIIDYLIRKYDSDLDPVYVHSHSWGKSTFNIGPYIIGGKDNNLDFKGGHEFYVRDRWMGRLLISLLRNPIDRVLSLYRMIHQFKIVKSHVLKNKYHYIAKGFSGFVETYPKELLNMQTYTFSKKLDVNEAFDILKSLDLVMINEFYQEGLDNLSKLLELDFSLREFHFKGESENAITNDEIIGDDVNSLSILKERLELDFELYNKFLSLRCFDENILK